jgi:3-deoxy-D-manno-octulosonic-acid transferase
VWMTLYSAALTLGLLVASPWWLLRMATTSRYREGLMQRLGRVPDTLRSITARKRVLWIHAVSVGEVLAASHLVSELEAELRAKFGDDWIVVISTTTRTGQALARERFGSGRVFYMPLDFGWAVRRYLHVLKPSLLILMESELWPRVLHECKRRSIPVAVVNARVSDRSFSRGLKLRRIWKHVLRMPTLWLAQSNEDARRLLTMGVRPQRVRPVGNLKYDVVASKESRLAELVRQSASGRLIGVAGSTLAGEEKFVLDAWKQILAVEEQALLILAPRHPERFNEVRDLVRENEFSYDSASMIGGMDEATLNGGHVLLLDTIGDLAAIYGLATVAFVGGSLVPRGGHNPLEPAQFGVPVIMGPSYENFRDIVGKMIAVDGIRIVQDEYELKSALEFLLTHPEEAAALGARGRAVFEQQQGATTRTVAAVLTLI